MSGNRKLRTTEIRANKYVFSLPSSTHSEIIKPLSLACISWRGYFVTGRVCYVCCLKNIWERIGNGPVRGGDIIHTVACTGLAYKLVAAKSGLDVHIAQSAFIDVMCRPDKRKERRVRRNKSERQQREQPHDKSLVGARSNMLVSMRERKIFLW
jgi:hypothetical protein